MSLVKKEDMTKLRPASEARSTADTAEDDIQLMAVAFAINNASNTGEYRVEFQEPLRTEVEEQLKSNGYNIRFLGDVYNTRRHCIISWKEEPVVQQEVSEDTLAEEDNSADTEE